MNENKKDPEYTECDKNYKPFDNTEKTAKDSQNVKSEPKECQTLNRTQD